MVTIGEIMRIKNFKTRMANRDLMAGTFIKTPAYELIEVLATSHLGLFALIWNTAPLIVVGRMPV